MLKSWKDRITFLLVLGILGFFGNNFYKLFMFTRPPIEVEDLKPGETDGTMLNVRLYVATAHLEPLSVGNLTVPYAWDYEKSLEDVVTRQPSYQLVDPTSEHHLTFSIPNEFRANQTIYLSARAFLADRPDVEALRPTVIPLSRPLIPSKLRHPTRLLLEDPSGEKTGALWDQLPNGKFPAVHSVPTFVEIGPIVETRPLSLQRVLEKGMRHLLDRGMDADGRRRIRWGMEINSFVFPRDEYVPLVKWDDLIDHDVKEKWMQEAPPSLLETANQVDGDIVIRIKYRPQSFGTFLFQNSIVASFANLEEVGFDEYDIDSLKMTMTGAAPWLVCVTFVISILHFLLEILFLSEDIAFWKGTVSFIGMSPFSILLNAVCSLVIALYLYDCGQSKLVVWFPLARAIIDFWKVFKLVVAAKSGELQKQKALEETAKTKKTDEQVVDEKTNQVTTVSYTEQEMERFERKAMIRILVLLLPAVAIYCGYELVNTPQKGWWSWLVGSLAACAYVGGFVVMTPQLLRNYKLKSVEHMPWSALTYQALSTFIDDLFALLVRMPNMHKMSVFRDDIAFVIFHIQRRMYRRVRVEDEEGKPAEHQAISAEEKKNHLTTFDFHIQRRMYRRVRVEDEEGKPAEHQAISAEEKKNQ